jgi:PA14 domain
MRSLALAACCAACGFSPIGELVDQGAAGFDGDLVGGSVASRGAIEPDTYYVGGLRARGYRNEGVTRTTTGADLAALFTQPTGEIVGQNFTNWGGDYPHGFGFGNGDHFSIVVDGEIYVPAGTTTYVLAADDAGFLEITIDGAITSVHSDVGTSGVLSLASATGGWYPVRGAMSESIGSAFFVLLDTTNGDPVAVPTSHLRAKTTDMHGLVTYLFALEEIEYLAGVWLDHGPIDHDQFTPGPSDYNLTTAFSARYAGQLLIDHATTSAITVDIGADLDDAFRLWIDGQLVASHWPTLDDRAVPVALVAGWHAIAFDYGNNVGTTSVHLRLDGAPVPSDHLRPAVAWGFPMQVYGNGTPVPWSGTTPATYSLTVPAVDGEVIDTIDLGYDIAGMQAGLAATLEQDGVIDPIAVRAMPNEINTASHLYDYDALRTAFVGMPLAGTWQFTVTPNGMSGAMTAVVAASIHGGPNMPFTPVVTYTSQPRPAGTIDRVHVEAQLDGATLAVAVRTADDVAQLANQPWTTVEGDGPPNVAAGDFLQYQLVITGDGWEFPSVESVEVDYHR